QCLGMANINGRSDRLRHASGRGGGAEEVLPVGVGGGRPLVAAGAEEVGGLPANPIRQELLGELWVEAKEALEQVAELEMAEQYVATRLPAPVLLQERVIVVREFVEVPRMADDLFVGQADILGAAAEADHGVGEVEAL